MPRVWLSGGSERIVADAIWKPHATVAALCERDGKYLLVKERVDDNIVFNQPAGHLDPGETLIEAVVRETFEETRYQFTPTALQGVYRYQPDPAGEITYLRFLFRGEVGERMDGELDHEIIEAQWLDYQQVLDCRRLHRSPMVMQCIDDYLRHPGYPLDLLSREFA